MLQASLGVQIHLVNIQGLFQQVLANPANFGFTNVTGSAINSSLNGNGYLFWDQEHPTTAADALIAEVAARIRARAVDVPGFRAVDRSGGLSGSGLAGEPRLPPCDHLFASMSTQTGGIETRSCSGASGGSIRRDSLCASCNASA